MASLFRSTLVRQSLRSFSRSAAPASRLVAQKQSTLQVNTPSLFSGGRYFSAEDLSALLAREHAEEIENDSAAMPPDLEELKKNLEQEWKIVDDGAMTRLYKNVGSSKVQVSFHCQDNVAIETEDFSEDVEADPEEGEPIRFTVTVTKAGKSMVLTCLSEFATARIQSVSLSSDPVETIQTSGIAAHQYQGPEFIELAEDLQDAFHAYLDEELGVSQDVATFVAMWADLKEQREYVHFLEDAKGLMP